MGFICVKPMLPDVSDNDKFRFPSFKSENKIIILTNGFQKKTQKTSKKLLSQELKIMLKILGCQHWISLSQPLEKK